MPGKQSGRKSGKKAGKNSAGLKKSKKSVKRSKGSAKSSKSQSGPPDLMHPAVAENLYFIAHDAPDALTKRGFGWPGATKGRKKGAKRGRKKK